MSQQETKSSESSNEQTSSGGNQTTTLEPSTSAPATSVSSLNRRRRVSRFAEIFGEMPERSAESTHTTQISGSPPEDVFTTPGTSSTGQLNINWSFPSAESTDLQYTYTSRPQSPSPNAFARQHNRQASTPAVEASTSLQFGAAPSAPMPEFIFPGTLSRSPFDPLNAPPRAHRRASSLNAPAPTSSPSRSRAPIPENPAIDQPTVPPSTPRPAKAGKSLRFALPEFHEEDRAPVSAGNLRRPNTGASRWSLAASSENVWRDHSWYKFGGDAEWDAEKMAELNERAENDESEDEWESEDCEIDYSGMDEPRWDSVEWEEQCAERSGGKEEEEKVEVEEED